MAFSTTSRSFTNLGSTTTDVHRNNSSTALPSTLGNGAGPWGIKTSSIWGNNSTTFVPRVPASEKPQPRDFKIDTSSDTINLKKGSGSLLAESDSWRPTPSRQDSTGRVPQSFTVETRNSSTNISPTSSRAPAINLTNSAFSSTRPSFTSAQTSGFFGSEPPNVYPKYRDHNASIDNSISTGAVSPVNERRPQWPTNYSSMSSRDQSRAPMSSHSDRQFSLAEYARSQQKHSSSISSQSNASYVNPEYIPSAFSHLSLERPTSSRSHAGYTRGIQTEDTEVGAYQTYNQYNAMYSTPASPNPYTFPNTRDFRPGQNPVQETRSRIEDFVPSKAWHENDAALIRRTPAIQGQGLLDQRFAAQMMAMKDPYNMYNPYNITTNTPYMGYYMGLGLNTVIQEPPPELVEGVQSAKLYDFKLAGKNNRRYELKDIYDHIAEFAGDQHGSRFIQNKLETANSDEKERVFREIEPNAIPLMTDVFGNYVIQKFFDHGHQEHKKILANKMRGQVLNLSTQMYGCRVVQKALEHVLLEQQAALVGELEHHVLKCVKDQNGNHVIQKAIERCPTETIAFVYQAFVGQVHTLSLHPYGCRVIQRCLERQEWFPVKGIILAELYESMPKGMIGDSYGNYVVQHVVENGPEADRQHVLNIVLSDLEAFSKHKFASNVVEKCIQYSTDVWRRRVVEILTTVDSRRVEGEGVLVGLIKDSFGNYVIQKLLDSLSAQDFLSFHQYLQPAMAHTKRTGSGKQVVSIEKKMQRFENLAGRNTTFQLSIPPNVFHSNHGSLSTTPPSLTADSHSIQSSSIPSINGDTVEGATSMSRKGSEALYDCA